MISQKGNVYTSVPLTQISLKYNPGNFICEQVAPTVQVAKDSGKIYSYGMDSLRIVNTYRAVGGKPNIVETTLSSADHYFLEDHVIGEFVPDEIIDNQEAPIQARINVVEALTDKLYLDKEKSLADTLTNTSNITQNITLSGTSQFNDYSNSDPIAVISTAVATVRSGSGKMPNSMIVAWDVLQKLKYHPHIVDFFPGAPRITDEMLESAVAQIFGLKQMFVGQAQYNNSNDGGNNNLADIWTKDMLIAYIEPTPTLMSRSLAFTYQKKAPRTVEELGIGKSLETLQRKSHYIQVSDKYDQVLVDEKCAYLIKFAIA